MLALGPVASQEAIKELGTNGGGFFNANSAHPFENPTPLTNLVEMLLIFAIPAGLTYTYGRMARDTRQGWAIFAAMGVLFLGGVAAAYWAEAQAERRRWPALALDQRSGNMEGKEARFGIAASALFATVTTDASCGAVNSMHDSFTPLGGLVPLVNIQLGEVIFGGVGAGLYGMLVFVVLAVFIAGLMVGRTPEYLGKKIESREMKLAMLYILIFPLLILGLRRLGRGAPSTEPRRSNNAGPHGLSEILYAYTSGAGNNGSAFAGLNANTPWWNITPGPGDARRPLPDDRPALAIAGAMVGKKTVPPGPGTFPTNGRALHRPAGRVVAHRRRAHLLPRAVARPHRRALRRPGTERSSSHGCHHPSSCRSSTRHPPAGGLATASASCRPRHVAKNPVMFVVEVGSVLTTVLLVRDLGAAHRRPRRCGSPALVIALALVHRPLRQLRRGGGRGPRQGPGRLAAQDAQGRSTRAGSWSTGGRRRSPPPRLRKGDTVVVEAGQFIPGDGEIIEGIASVDESAITGESAPVIRESGGDRAAVTGGTKVLSDRIVVRITANPGESFLDRMIALVEGAARQKTPNEIALHILLVGLTLIFLSPA